MEGPYNPDYLKYWRPISHFICKKYDLSIWDLYILLFLRSEIYFTKRQFTMCSQVMSWNAQRFDMLIRRGFIVLFRDGSSKECAKYQLSRLAINMITSIYEYLNGNTVSESPDSNPLMGLNKSYTDKVCRNALFERNQKIRAEKQKKFRPQQPHPFQE